MAIFHYMRGWKTLTKMVSDMDAMFSYIFNLYKLYCAQGLLHGSPLKKEVGFWGLFYQGEVGKGRVKRHHFITRQLFKIIILCFLFVN